LTPILLAATGTLNTVPAALLADLDCCRPDRLQAKWTKFRRRLTLIADGPPDRP
jgi:hypothetical protein